MIHVKDLRRSFAGTVALDGVSFDVEPGEVVGLLGPNGAGKTTTMRVLTCFVPADSGTVEVDGLDVGRHSLEVRRRVGYLPEGVPLYPELRVVEHLNFRARLRGLPRARRRAEVDRVVQACGLGDVSKRIVGQLSRGFRQRLGLADALLGDPRVLILDEPTVALDPNQVRQVRRLIRELGGEHTVLLSTHILTEVEAVCSRALIIHQGRLRARQRVGGAGQLKVRVRGPAAAVRAALKRVEGVASARVQGEADGEVATLLLSGEQSDRTRERVAAAVSEAGWGLLGMEQARESLEQLFTRVTGAAQGDE